MLGIDYSAARSKHLGKKLITSASTAVIASSGFMMICQPASAAETETCTAAQARYQTAGASAAAIKALPGRIAEATQAVAAAQQARDTLAASAPEDSIRAQDGIDVAVATKIKAGTNLAWAQDVLRSVLAAARSATDRLDAIQAEFDGLHEVNAAAEKNARTLLDAATATRSAAAAAVSAVRTTLEAATASHSRTAIEAAQADLVSKQKVLEASEAQIVSAEMTLKVVLATGKGQEAEFDYRMQDAQQMFWELDGQLEEADLRVRSAEEEAAAAAEAVAQAKDALVTAQNLDGIAAADAALTTAQAAVTALHAQTTTPPDPASIDRLLRAATDACAATRVVIPQTPVAPAKATVAPAPATTVAREAPAGIQFAEPGQKTVDVTAANPGFSVQTGVVTVPAVQVSADPRDQGWLAMAAWSFGGLLVLAAISFGVRGGRLRAWMTNGSPSD